MAIGTNIERKIPMTRRLYPAVLLVLAAVLVFAVAANAAPQLGKPSARKASVAKLNRFLAKHDWADAGRVGACRRAAPSRILCKLVLRGPSRSCVGWVKVSLRGKTRIKSQITRLRCRNGAEFDKRIVRLRASLGMARRDPLDPFLVTYPFSAGAVSEEEAGLAEVAPPEGVLSLYTDGILECAINVGEGLTTEDCPVKYEKLGTHRVTSVYTSGSESSAVTTQETVEPLPTETSLSVTYEPLAQATSGFGCGDDSVCNTEMGWHGNGGFNVGVLRVQGSVSPWGTAPISACPSGDANCASLSLDAEGAAEFPVSVIANYVALEEKPLAIGETETIEPEAVKNVTIQGAPEFAQIPLADITSGIRYFQVASPAKAGYAGSVAKVPIQFSPVVTSPVERVPCGC